MNKQPKQPAFAHRRTIECETRQRDDGMWELEATLLDVKGVPFVVAKGTVMPCDPLHSMRLSLVFDNSLTVREARARLYSGPAADCHHVDTTYNALVGMNLGPGFAAQAKERFGRTAGCTHMNELLPVVVTVAIQTDFAIRSEGGIAALRPFLPLIENQCHTWRSDGPSMQAVREAMQGEGKR